MYRHVLVPIAHDEEPAKTDEALNIAGRLAAPGAQVVLLHVIESVPAFVAAQIPAELLKAARADAEAMLKAVAARSPVPATTALVSGHGGRSIVEYAEEKDVDCIVVNSHRPEAQDVFFGTTAASIVRHAPCSVHVLR